MARQNQTSEFNNFTGGLITEASPLTFPGNASLDINNFVLDKNGSISRRLGMDYEFGYEVIDTGVSTDGAGELSIKVFNWENAGGDSTVNLAVIQTGNVLKFFNTGKGVVSTELIHTHTFPTADVNINLSYSVVDGMLVVVGAGKEPSYFLYEDGVITGDTYTLKIRDLFGVGAFADVDGTSVNLREPSNINLRPDPSPNPDGHIYNLRNSTYALMRLKPEGLSLEDPIHSFVVDLIETSEGVFGEVEIQLPSNADSVTSALYADAEQKDDRLSERFHPQILRRSPRGNFESPLGYFIIDALERGTSRLNNINNLSSYRTEGSPEYLYNVESLPLDKTPGGATVVAEFAGRAWYAGFSGEIIDGDDHSPRMSSYVLFSKIITSKAELGVCHQIGDPTSKEAPDLLETDGGFIRLDEAYGIKKLINTGSNLIVVAENGVWAIVGGSDYGFTATTYKVSKITNHGCSNTDSVVLVDDSVLYWGDDGIYQVSRNELGDLNATNITNSTIQTLYDNISDLEKSSVQGYFDTYSRKVNWLYKNRISSSEDTRELVLDVTLSAFYLNTIPTASIGSPNAVAYIEVPPFRTGEITQDVYYGGEQVLYGVEEVEYTSSISINGLRELLYLTVIQTTPTVTYTMSKYTDSDFIDWKSHDGVGQDSPAYMITGYNGGGDYQRNKQVPYVTFHFTKTEDGFAADELGDIYPTRESSCKVQAQWEWANSTTSGRWGKEFQAYRHKRAYIPEDVNDGYDNGFSIVTTKNKLRGKGRVLSLQVKTEPLKDCKLLGWSVMTSGATNV